MEHEDTEMIKRIQSDYLEPDKLTCHLGWYRRQQQSKIIEQRDNLLKVCKLMQKQFYLTWSAVHLTPNIAHGLKRIRELAEQAIANATEE